MQRIPEAWTFETSAVADAFDAHVREQLPWYDLATAGMAHLARHYLPRGGLAYDFGASTGNVGRALAPILAERGADLIPVESSGEMAARYVGPGADRLIIGDATEIEIKAFDVGVLFLTAMFVPVPQRGAFLARLRERLRPGGALIVVDRMLPGAGYAATVLWRLTLAHKVAAGAPADQVIAKELSLGGVQRGMARAELPADAVEWFRMGDFAGWLIEAPHA